MVGIFNIIVVLIIVRQETVLLILAFVQMELPDFAGFVFFTAATISLCGPYLISLKPDFVDNFARISFMPPHLLRNAIRAG